jgi:hypothetical protein
LVTSCPGHQQIEGPRAQGCHLPVRQQPPLMGLQLEAAKSKGVRRFRTVQHAEQHSDPASAAMPHRSNAW